MRAGAAQWIRSAAYVSSALRTGGTHAVIQNVGGSARKLAGTRLQPFGTSRITGIGAKNVTGCALRLMDGGYRIDAHGPQRRQRRSGPCHYGQQHRDESDGEGVGWADSIQL